MRPLAAMKRPERIAYLESLADQLRTKRQRERSYLDRRAKRGTHTPTDEAYEADQLLEGKLLAILDELIALDIQRQSEKSE